MNGFTATEMPHHSTIYPPQPKDEICRKDEFIAYEAVRSSGATNMFNVKMVEELSGLDRETIFSIMKNYSELAEAYLGDK